MKTQHTLFRLGLMLALVLSFGLSSTALAATVTWTGGGSDNNWNTVGNWDVHVPLSGDDVIIPAGSLVNVDVATAPIASLQVNEYARLTGTGTITMNGNITFIGPGQRKIDNVNITLASGPSTITMSNDNELVIADLNVADQNLAISGSYAMTVTGDITGTTGNITTDAATTNASIKLGGNITTAGGALAFNTPGTIDFIFTGSTNVTAGAITEIDFNNITVLKGATVTTANATSGFDIYGDVTLVGNGSFAGNALSQITLLGTSTLNVAPKATLSLGLVDIPATGNVTLNGDMTVSGTGATAFQVSASGGKFTQTEGTFTFSGAAPVITNAGAGADMVFYNLSAATGTNLVLTAGDIVTVAGDLTTIGTGTFNAGGAACEVIFNNNATRENPKTITAGGAVDFDAITIATNSHVTTASSFSYAVAGAAAFTVNSGASFVATASAVDATTGPGTLVNTGYLEFFDYNNTAGAGVITAAQEIVIANDLIATAGSITAGAGSKVIMTGTAGTLSTNAGGGTLTLANLEIADGANIQQTSAETIAITENFEVKGDGNFIAVANAATFTQFSGAPSNIIVSDAGKATFANVTVTGGTLNTASNLTLDGILAVAGFNFEATAGTATLLTNFDATAGAVTAIKFNNVYVNADVNTGGNVTNGFQVAGNFEVSAAGNFSITATEVVEFIGTGTKRIINNGTLDFDILNINTGTSNIVTTKSNFTVGAGSSAGALTVLGTDATNGAFIAEEGTVTIAGGTAASIVTQGTSEANAGALQFFNLTIDAATPATSFIVKGDFNSAAAAFDPTAGTVYFKGSTPQTFTGTGESMLNVVLNNPTGLTLLSDMNFAGVANTLELVSGDIDLNGNNNIIFDTDTDVLIETVGNTIKNTGARTYPGDGGYVQITSAGGADPFTALGATFDFDGAPGATVLRRYHHPLNIDDNKISMMRYYALDHAAKNLTGVTFNYDNSEIIGDAANYGIYTLVTQDPAIAYATAYTTQPSVPSVGAGTGSVTSTLSAGIAAPTNFVIVGVAADNFDTFDNGGGDNLWTNAANWTDGTVPTSSDHVLVLPGFIAELPVGAAKTAKSLTIGLPYAAGVTQVRPVNGDVTSITIGGDIIIPDGAAASGFRGKNNVGRLNTEVNAAGTGVKIFSAVNATGLAGLNFNNLALTNTSASYLGNYNIAIAGNFNITGASGSWVADNPANGTTTFNGGGAQAITVDDLSFCQFVNLTTSGANTAVTTAADLNIRGTINTTGANTSFAATDGNITLDPARAGLTGWVSNNNATNPNLTFSNLFVSGGLNLAPTTNVNVAADFVKSGNGNFASSAKTIFNNTSFAPEDIIVSGLGSVSFSGLLFPNGSNVATANNFNVGSLGIEVAGNGSFVATNGTITQTGGTLIKSNQGTLSLFNYTANGTIATTANLTIAGNLKVTDASSFAAGDGSITFANAIPRTIRNDGTLTFHRLVVASGSTLSTDALGDDYTIGSTAGSTAQGIEVASGASFTMASGVANFASAVAKDIINDGTLSFYDVNLATAAFSLSSEDSYTIKGGNVTIGAGATLSSTGGMVTFDRTAADPLLEDNTLRITNGGTLYRLKDVTFANDTYAMLTAGSIISVTGNFSVNNQATFEAENNAGVLFNGAASAQTIGGNSTATLPISFSDLTINNTNNVMLATDIEISNTAGSSLTLTSGQLNLASHTLRLGAATLARTNGSINGATGTVELIDGLGGTNLLDDALFASTLYNLTVSDYQDTEGNLKVKNNLTLNDWFDITGDNLTVMGNLTQADANQRLVLGTTGKLILSGTGTTAGLSNAYFDGMSAYNLELKRSETLGGDLDIAGEFKLHTGVQELSTSAYDLTFLNGTSSIVLESGQINAEFGSTIYMEASYNAVPLNLFKDNTTDNFVTFAAISLGGDHKVNSDWVQVGGPYDVTTTANNTLTLGPNSDIVVAFDEDNHVIGNLRRTVTNEATSFNVGGGATATYRPITLQFANIGNSQDVLVSAAAVDPVYSRAGMVDNSVNVVWNVKAEGTAPNDSLRMTLQWQTGDEDFIPEDANAGIGNGAFITKWNTVNNSWISYRSSTADTDNNNIFDLGPARVLNFNVAEYPIKANMLSGDWAAFIASKTQPDIAGSWATLSAAPYSWTLDTLKDRALRNTVNKVAVKEITPAPPINSGTAFSVTVELQNEFGEPVVNNSGTPFNVVVSLNAGSGALTTPPNGIIPVGESSVIMSGFSITDAAGSEGYQLRSAPASINTDPNTGDLTSNSWLSGLSETFSVIGNDPVAQASNLLFSNVTNTSMTVSWAAVGNTILVARAGNPITAEPIDGTTYSANSIFGLGSTIEDGVVIYVGSGSSVDVSGLAPGTQYFFQAYSFAGNVGSENYLTEVAAANNPRAQNTAGAGFDDDVLLGENNTRLTSKTVGTNSPFKGTVKAAGDEDWFNFKVSNISANVRVKLFDLPGDYNIEMYNSATRRVRRATLTGGTDEAFVINELTPGTYTIRIYGVNSVSDAVNPYSLLITTKENEIFSVTP